LGITLVVGLLAIPAMAATTTSTYIMYTGVNQDTGHMEATAAVDPQTPGGNMLGKYMKKTPTGWVLIKKVTGTLDENSWFGPDFGPPSKAHTCKVVAKFLGSETLAPSKHSLVVNCATGRQR
jgi:hypothetical protein